MIMSFRPLIYDESETDQILNAKYLVWKNYTLGKWGTRKACNQNSLMQLFNGDRRIVNATMRFQCWNWFYCKKSESISGSLHIYLETSIEFRKSKIIINNTDQRYFPMFKVLSIGSPVSGPQVHIKVGELVDLLVPVLHPWLSSRTSTQAPRTPPSSIWKGYSVRKCRAIF